MSTLIADDLTNAFHFTFEQTVPRSLVHKRSLENVLLTEVRGYGENRFVCAGRIPTAHRFFNDAGRTPQEDILFYTELGRQASLAISHTFFGVAKEEVFIFEQSQAWMKDAAWRSSFKPAPESVITEIRVRETERRRNNAVSRIVADQVMSIAGQEVFHGVGAWTVQPPALFQRLRRMSKRQGSAPAEISLAPRRAAHDNVVIVGPKANDERTEFEAALIVDETHPYFFDHPCDHIPGMLLLEACRQLAQSAISNTTSVAAENIAVAGCEVNFRQFVECDVPVTLTARFSPGVSTSLFPESVNISISQQDVVCGTATMSVAFPH